MNLTKKNKWLALIALVVLAAAVFSVTFAWLAGSNIIKSTIDKGSILTSYFHTGDGSEENPFVITRPLHFYNMIYLYQRLEGFADEGYYFQLGYQLLYDENAQTPDENYYFYKYGDDGKIVPGQYSTVLNMAYYSDKEGMGGALLPIGTSDVPFLGTFDGKGLTVANLHVTGSETIGNDTLATSDIGIFGYVDEGATVKNTYFDGVTIDLSGLDPTSTTEDDTHDATHHDENKDGTPDLSYVGFLAGHIKTSSIVQNVYLNNCTVVGGDAARSGYGFFGCVEKADGTLVDSLGSEVTTLRGGGDNAGFGGSIDMYSTFQRLMTIYNTVRNGTSQYVTAETIVIDEVEGGSENVLVPPSPTMTNYGNYSTITYKSYTSPTTGGSFMFPNDNDTSESGSGNIYECLFGESSVYTKTVTTYTYKDLFDEDGLLISIGGSYLNATTSGLSAGNDADAATIWQLDGAGHLNALLEESTRYNTYYLNASANGTLSVSTSATTVWTKNEDANHEGTLTYTSGGRTWYLSLENGTWGGYPFDSAFSISNGANYLGQSNATTIAGTAGNHADWHFEDGKLMTFINKTIYYLNASGGALSLGTNAGSATTWTRNGNVFSYTDGNSRTWYLAYNNGWCCLPFAEGFTIAYNTNYLGTTNGSAVTSVASGSALHFSLENGKLVTYYNNTLYYLNASAGALSLGTNAGSATTWTKNDAAHTITYTDANSRTWYLVYDGTWHCVPFVEGFTIANNTNYLGYSGSAVTSVASGSALHFALENNKLVTYYNNTLYYLNASANGTLSLGTSAGSATTWTKTEDGNHEGTLTYTSGGRTWYLSYDGSAWGGYPFDSAFSIYNGANYLVQSSSTTLAGTAGNHAGWHFEGGKLMTFINKTIYYLNASAGALSLGTSEGSATTWTRNGNTFTYTSGGRTWYLAYNNGWCCLPFAEGFTVANNTNYLGYNGSAFTSTSAANALHFSFENGKVVTYYNNTLYYLTASGATLSLTTSTPSITWVKGADTLSYTDGNDRTWYLRYLNGAWDLYPSLSSYTIRSGNSYFGVSGANVTLTNQAGAANWVIEGNKLYTVVNGTLYYLVGSSDGSGTLSLNATRANGTDWTYTQGGGTMSYTANGETWYLYIRDGAWTVLPGSSYNLIAQNGNHLHATSTTAVDGTAIEDASEWFIDGDGHIYTFYSGARRYLTASGAAISLSNSGTTVWTRNGNNTVTDARGWYLVYDAGWKCYPALSYVLITDGTNYLTRSGNSGVTNTTTAASASRWFADGSKLYTLDDAGTKYYLAGNTTALSVTTTAGNGTAFTYDGTNKRLTYTVSANTYYVIYNNGWTVSQSYQNASTIKASTGNYYLNATTTTVSTGTNAGSATQWYFNASTGRLYTEIASVKYYLQAANEQNNKYGSTNLTVTNNENNATAFTYSGNRLTCTLNGATYSLSLHNNTFKMVNTNKTYYTVQSTGGYYLSLNESTYSAPTDQNDAVLWEFSNDATPSGGNSTNTTISTLVKGNVRYMTLNNSLGLGNSQTLQYYAYSSGWFSSTIYYYIRYNTSNYLRYNNGWTRRGSRNDNDRITRTAVTFTAATLTFNGAIYETTEQAGSITATTTFTTTNALNNATFTAAANGTTQTFASVSENITQTTAAEADRNTNTMAPVSETITLTTSSVTENVTHTTAAEPEHITLDYTVKRRQHIEKTVESNVRSGSPTYFPIRVDKDKNGNYPSGYAASPKNTGYIISGANLINSGSTPTTQKKWGDIRVSGFEIANIEGSWSTSGLTVTKIRNGNNYLYLEKDDETEEYSIANTTNADKANFWQYSGNKLFTTVGKTKYWLTYDNGLKLSETEGVEWTFSNSNRLAYNNNYIKYTDGAWVATANSQNLTVTLGTLNTVYTVDGNSNAIRELNSDELNDEAYKQAALQLSQTLATSSTRVFGLHFMDAAISTDHIVTAPKASIFGTEYTDYEFPEDSVDFNVIERGSISFFAGEYFSSNGVTNDAFFSLHQVYRYKADDPAVLAGTKKVNDIKYIKEIAEVYKHATEGDSTNYVYKFSDNTYSNPDGTYTGANSLADGYSNTPVFKTTWITAPSGLNKSSARIFFFKIPCNAGEYCLGSVSGKTGAYLIYLDIAANGGEELASAISGTGNDVVTSFQTEFRDAPDTMDHSVILLSYDAPDGATPETFSVSVNFDKTAAASLEDPHPSGLYTIDVVNKTGSDVTLYVYLCDDDFNLLTAFPYAYKVHYTNTTTGARGTYLETVVGDTFQMMAGFTIPSSGEAIEVSYH